MADANTLRGIIAHWTGDVDPSKVGGGLGGELAQRKMMQQAGQNVPIQPMPSPSAPAPMDLVNPNYVPRGGQVMLEKVLSGQMDAPMNGIKKSAAPTLAARPRPTSPDMAMY